MKLAFFFSYSDCCCCSGVAGFCGHQGQSWSTTTGQAAMRRAAYLVDVLQSPGRLWLARRPLLADIAEAGAAPVGVAVGVLVVVGEFDPPARSARHGEECSCREWDGCAVGASAEARELEATKGRVQEVQEESVSSIRTGSLGSARSARVARGNSAEKRRGTGRQRVAVRCRDRTAGRQ